MFVDLSVLSDFLFVQFVFNKQEEIVHSSGTTFSSVLIHMWCSCEYLWQQDSVCVHADDEEDISDFNTCQETLSVLFESQHVDRKRNKESEQTWREKLRVSFQRSFSKTCSEQLVNKRRQEADWAAFAPQTPRSTFTPPLPALHQTIICFSHQPSSEHLTGIYEVMGNEAAAALKIHNSVVYVRGALWSETLHRGSDRRPPSCDEVWNGSLCPSQLSAVIKTLIKTVAHKPRPYQTDKESNLQH